MDKKIINQVDQWALDAKKGDSQAFGNIYDALVKPIYRYIYYRAPQHIAEDLTEETFLKAWKNLKKYKNTNAHFHSWVFRIAHNLVCDYFRKNQDALELSESVPAAEKNQPDKQMEVKSIQLHLKKAIKKLKEPYQEVILLRYVNEMNHSEMAQILGKSEGAVRTLQTRAIKQLKLILEKKPRTALQKSEYADQ